MPTEAPSFLVTPAPGRAWTGEACAGPGLRQLANPRAGAGTGATRGKRFISVAGPMAAFAKPRAGCRPSPTKQGVFALAPRLLKRASRMMVALQRLIEALRHELQQYGEMLALLDHQQELLRLRGAEAMPRSLAAIDAQSARIQEAREQRRVCQEHLARSLSQPEGATFARLTPLLPAHYQPLITALVQENNELLQRVRQRAQENQSLLRRSLEWMQHFITTLAPQEPPPAVDVPEQPVLAVAPESPLYQAIA
jgi:flagellar biosynthesis/type III secretory pathway chaperone